MEASVDPSFSAGQPEAETAAQSMLLMSMFAGLCLQKAEDIWLGRKRSLKQSGRAGGTGKESEVTCYYGCWRKGHLGTGRNLPNSTYQALKKLASQVRELRKRLEGQRRSHEQKRETSPGQKWENPFLELLMGSQGVYPERDSRVRGLYVVSHSPVRRHWLHWGVLEHGCSRSRGSKHDGYTCTSQIGRSKGCQGPDGSKNGGIHIWLH